MSVGAKVWVEGAGRVRFRNLAIFAMWSWLFAFCGSSNSHGASHARARPLGRWGPMGILVPAALCCAAVCAPHLGCLARRILPYTVAPGAPHGAAAVALICRGENTMRVGADKGVFFQLDQIIVFTRKSIDSKDRRFGAIEKHFID